MTELTKVSRRIYKRAAEGGVITHSVSYDQVITEAPLQIRVAWQCKASNQQKARVLLTTMRTPGKDDLLTTGLLYSNGLISKKSDITQLESLEENTIEATLAEGIEPDFTSLERHGLSSASCGICGQKQIQQLSLIYDPVTDNKTHWVLVEDILSFPCTMREKQNAFTSTGGVHAAALWNRGHYVALEEDVGRHNAVDKILGKKLTTNLKEEVDAQCFLVLSGRISFELVHKAIVANIPVIAAFGAPSSLALQLAKQFNITLIGFVKSDQCNVYCGDVRLL